MTRATRHGSATAGSPSFIRRVVDLYVGGFREMTVGRKLWVIILIKLAVMFLVFRLFFFPDKLAQEYDNDSDRAEAVRKSLLGGEKPHNDIP